MVTGPAFDIDSVPTVGKAGVAVPAGTWKTMYEPRVAPSPSLSSSMKFHPIDQAPP